MSKKKKIKTETETTYIIYQNKNWDTVLYGSMTLLPNEKVVGSDEEGNKIDIGYYKVKKK
jgi:hypothetical protein